MISLNVNVFIGAIVVREKCIEVGWRICREILTEKVPCGEDASSYDRNLDKQDDVNVKGLDIPISSTLASGMVPLLTYAMRLLPK